MRAKIGKAVHKHKDRIFQDGTDDPLGDILRKHGAPEKLTDFVGRGTGRFEGPNESTREPTLGKRGRD